MRRAQSGADNLSWEQYRKQMLDETSRFIEWGLRHPEEVIEIPVKPAEEGGFASGAGQWFWGVVLTDNVTDHIRRWRDILLRRPKGLLRKIGLR